MLLDAAVSAANQAEFFLDYKRPDLAFVEHVVAQELALIVIPTHKDFPTLQNDTGRLRQQWRKLLGVLQSHTQRFEDIKQIIINDNIRCGTQPAGMARPKTPVSQRPPSPLASVGGQISISGRPLSMPDNFSGENERLEASHIVARADQLNGRLTSMSVESLSRRSPVVKPKPQNLHGRVIEHEGFAHGDPGPICGNSLSERFQRLRMSGHAHPGLDQTQDRKESDISGLGPLGLRPTQVPSNRAPSTPYSSLNTEQNGKLPPDRPSGPRELPASANGPPHPPKLPLDISVADALPKPPEPIYSPARNMDTAGNIDPPRTSARSMVGSGCRSNNMSHTSLASQHTQPNNDDGLHTSKPQTWPTTAQPGRKSVHLPQETMISALRLLDYLRMYNVLLIDVRSRSEFDEGHIFERSIMCIEPAALRKGMSADQLVESLVLSPDKEQEMFDQRDNYDLAVYYDQSTSSDAYLDRHPRDQHEEALSYLHDALYEFNDKPLQRPPILLKGGIEAWIDLVGERALQTSDTVSATKAALKRSQAARRPIARVPSDKPMLYLQKRRRDYNPLDPDEERKWLDKARKESITVAEHPTDGQDEAIQVEEATPIIRDYEDFYKRFPDASAIEQQSMVAPPQRPPPNRPLPPMPDYPAPPTPSALSRPPPALSRPSYSGVRDTSDSTRTPLTRSSTLPHYVSPKYLPQNVRLPRTGLINFGVTCYMNATIQCLSATTPLSMFFLDSAFRNLVQHKNWKGSKGIMPEYFSNLIHSLWKNDVAAIRPSSFRTFCARLNREWGLDRQQDAKEFLDFLLDCLHEDLNSNWTRTPLRALTAAQEQAREAMPPTLVARKEWDRYLHRESSFLTSLFAGQHASRLRCTSCNHTSTTHEAFYSISVEIPRAGTGSLTDCLRHYCAEERLSGDEVWKCPRCRKEREATKRIVITRAPQFLVVHFKRFATVPGQSAKKLRTPVDFPLKGLDLAPYMLPPPTTQEVSTIASQYGQEAIEGVTSDEAMTPPFRYDAYAVMRHLGTTMTSGHYVALVKDAARGTWRCFNDTRVDDFYPEKLRESEALQNEQAYIVFYQRVAG